MALVTELQALANQAAKRGGATLMEWRQKFETHIKGPDDLVTDADFASQKAIREALLSARPEDHFFGEESEVKQVPSDPEVVCWVVDPLDGTMNYVHGFPCYATSIAAVIDGKVVAGAIYDPLRDELFSAARGEGATLNDRPLKVSKTAELGNSLVAVSLPPAVDANSTDLADFIAVVQRCRAIRRTGSAALNLAYVAAGWLDAHWALQIHPWDSAAGTLMIEEAGGVVTDRHGGPFDVWQGHYLTTSTKELYNELAPYLNVPKR